MTCTHILDFRIRIDIHFLLLKACVAVWGSEWSAVVYGWRLHVTEEKCLAQKPTHEDIQAIGAFLGTLNYIIR
jgi:hypothetical protein